MWLSSLIWGEIYVRGMTPLGIWNSASVRLFYVKHAQNPQRQLTETVSSVVGGLLGRGTPEPPQLLRQLSMSPSDVDGVKVGVASTTSIATDMRCLCDAAERELSA